MPLSTNGLQEGDFTLLRVLKNGILQDVLSLTASGTPDISQGSLVIGHTSGLQTQLNAKASTTALTSLATEIDILEDGVGALGNAVGVIGSTVVSLGAAVEAKAAQVSLDATNATVDILNAARVGMQSTIAATATNLVYTQNDLTALTSVVATKASSVTLGDVNTTLTRRNRSVPRS
jgi:hypothetical protein